MYARGIKPSFPLEYLADEKAMNIFKETYEWVIEQLKTDSLYVNMLALYCIK